MTPLNNNVLKNKTLLANIIPEPKQTHWLEIFLDTHHAVRLMTTVTELMFYK